MPLDLFLQQHSGELMILALSALLLGSLLILVPQLLRAQLTWHEARHAENMRCIDQGLPPIRSDERSLSAGRVALLVPIVSVCAAGTVTCFIVAYRSDIVFSVSLAVWAIAGVVSLCAIICGLALLGRLAQLHTGSEEEELAENPLGRQ
jgi:hypothetical protein